MIRTEKYMDKNEIRDTESKLKIANICALFKMRTLGHREFKFSKATEVMAEL